MLFLSYTPKHIRQHYPDQLSKFFTSFHNDNLPISNYTYLAHICSRPPNNTNRFVNTHKLFMVFFFFLPFDKQVAWIHFEQSAILTVHNHVITRNPRISVTHDKHDKHRTWFLHINNVKEEDHGRYMCQINTVTAKTQFGYVHVVGKSILIIEVSFSLPLS